MNQSANTARYYFECHITIDPVFDDRLSLAQQLSKEHGFAVADLFMQKRPVDTPTRSRFDTFMTGRGKHYDQLQDRMNSLIRDLHRHDFIIRRYKIEDTILDSKYTRPHLEEQPDGSYLQMPDQPQEDQSWQ